MKNKSPDSLRTHYRTFVDAHGSQQNTLASRELSAEGVALGAEDAYRRTTSPARRERSGVLAN
jgi:hypothetical protein